MLYEKIVRPILFASSPQDPEIIHERMLRVLELMGRSKAALSLLKAALGFEDHRLERTVFGIKFPNPVGLAAGFDKNAWALPALAALGFGFIEMGTVTAKAQPGNPRPRLFRLPTDEALINCMGFNNDGADAVAACLARIPKLSVPLGISIGKSKVTPIEEAVDDYLYSLRVLYPHGDYFAVNVSSPNTPGLRSLQQKDQLQSLLQTLVGEAKLLAGVAVSPKPVLVKIAPDLTEQAILEALEVCAATGVAGIIATNTTLNRSGLQTRITEDGGLSGQPLTERALEVVQFIHREAPRLPIVGVGGIGSAEQALAMLEAGASLLQLYTGFIYQGPLLPRRINQFLSRRV